jgi:molybdopterin converting factor small subunit
MKIFYFAQIARALGRREDELRVPAPLDAGALWTRLIEHCAALAPFRATARFVRNGEYAGLAEQFHDGDEVGLLPPVSGG